MLIDSHCHLDYLERDGVDIDQVIAQAKEAGVQYCLTIGTKWSEREKQVSLANRFPGIFASIGIHPHETASESAPSLNEFLDFMQQPKLVGIGETGLDYYYDHSDKDSQMTSFLWHIEAAQITGLPLIIHCRDADEVMIDTITYTQKQKPYKGVVHCFSGSKALAECAIEFGMYLSLSGIITFKSAEALRHIIRDIPLKHLLVETDSPYLAPIPFRGKSNQPAYAAHTAQKLAQIKGVGMEELAKHTSENCRILFDKADFIAS